MRADVGIGPYGCTLFRHGGSTHPTYVPTKVPFITPPLCYLAIIPKS